ncbi:MAG: exonuclease sbcCD subunit D [Bacteroidetes bacterium CG_4_10_14_3_um_filter_31_20]|nr:MAG: exonuclease sbcCD subunit D [Bacteroidetes bacterium CG_4_8_14_3_um_filter_31_14]PIY02105.1 MAG: exonuclease sbcCD subunit D [Bacteroidetes bacterium CG_4_10_14_3_um_filter_31_20]
MKILHTSDWHLGKYLDDFSRHNEQIEVLHEICEIANSVNVDAVIIAGDLFDTYNPPTESIELFYKTLKKLSNNGKRAIVAIAGNHDSPDRIETPDPLARECGIIFIGYPNTKVAEFELDSGLKVVKSEEGFIEIKLPNVAEMLRIIHTSYANEFRLKTFLGCNDKEEQLRKVLENKWKQIADKYCDNKGVNILLSHLFFIKENGIKPEEPENEKPILHVGGAQEIFSSNIPEQMQYVALGHLHRKQIVDNEPCPIIYSGSPLSYSFAETEQNKYVISVQINCGQKAIVKEIALTKGKKLLRHKAESIADAIEWLKSNQESLVELTIVSNTYLSAKDRKQLVNTHNGIINIIPEIKNKEILNYNNAQIDISKNIDELFKEYFIHEKGQEPNENIMNLLKEVLSEEAGE